MEREADLVEVHQERVLLVGGRRRQREALHGLGGLLGDEGLGVALSALQEGLGARVAELSQRGVGEGADELVRVVGVSVEEFEEPFGVRRVGPGGGDDGLHGEGAVVADFSGVCFDVLHERRDGAAVADLNERAECPGASVSLGGVEGLYERYGGGGAHEDDLSQGAVSLFTQWVMEEADEALRARVLVLLKHVVEVVVAHKSPGVRGQHPAGVFDVSHAQRDVVRLFVSIIDDVDVGCRLMSVMNDALNGDGFDSPCPESGVGRHALEARLGEVLTGGAGVFAVVMDHLDEHQGVVIEFVACGGGVDDGSGVVACVAFGALCGALVDAVGGGGADGVKADAGDVKGVEAVEVLIDDGGFKVLEALLEDGVGVVAGERGGHEAGGHEHDREVLGSEDVRRHVLIQCHAVNRPER